MERIRRVCLTDLVAKSPAYFACLAGFFRRARVFSQEESIKLIALNSLADDLKEVEMEVRGMT